MKISSDRQLYSLNENRRTSPPGELISYVDDECIGYIASVDP